jgi:hypothetical protein
MTLCLLDEVKGAERIYPAKVFELMRLGRPSLVLAPRGALTELVERHRAAEVVAPRDVPKIAEALERRLREFSLGRYCIEARPQGIERYDRRRLAGEFAEAFRKARDATGTGAVYQVTFWVPRAKRQSPTTAAALSTTKLRASRERRPPRGPSAASA